MLIIPYTNRGFVDVMTYALFRKFAK